jgi:diaminohydroxyphosphoribosylaminopyrimidine deaminase/5-amino-6-(5-phosphoribosylamino)uracil reductase
MIADSDKNHMLRCIDLAMRGEYSCKPNPRVGSIVVKNNEVLAEGWHRYAGQVHAEVDALEKAGEAARGATLYVTLEPCSHQGRTAPCSDAIIKAGISKVVFGMIDPNPQVAGAGISKLEAAGLEVLGPVLHEQCAALNPGFIKRMTTGLPYVRCKMAMSLDGRTAMASGESKWISGPESREDVQRWRARSGAIITGIGSILADDPSLNVRLNEFDNDQPIRVVCDSTLQMPAGAKTLQLAGQVLLATAEDKSFEAAELAADIECKSFNSGTGKTDLKALLAYLAAKKECNEVLIEAGSRLAGAFIELGLVDELLIYLAPKLLGHRGHPLFTIHGMDRIKDQIALEFIDVSLLGKDCRMRSRILKKQ